MHLSRKTLLISLFSIIESFLQVYGFILTKNQSISNFNIKYTFITILVSIIFFIINMLLYKLISYKYKNNYSYNFSKKIFLLTWILIFILWIPVLLAYYPTLWTYDVHIQIPHITGDKISAFQPIFHSLFLELFLIIGKKINSYEFGMLLLSIIQMTILSCIFAYSIEKAKEKIKNKTLLYLFTIFLIIFYGIFPVNSIMSISMTKDVLFSGFILFLIISSYDFIDNKKISKFQEIIYIIVSTLTMLIKNNGIIIFLSFAIISILLIKPNKKKIIKINALPILTYYVIMTISVLILKPEQGYKFEKYSVQTQNLVYIVSKHPELDVKNDELLFDFIQRDCFYDDIKKSQFIHNSDASKFCFIYCLSNYFNEKKFLNIWFKYAKKYPLDYIDSWSNLTIGSWYLFDDSHANIYKYDKTGYLATDFKKIKELNMDKPKNKNPWLYDKLELIATKNIQYKGKNILRFIFSPATYILVFLFFIIYIICNKLKQEIIPIILLISIYLCILVGPLIIVRYIYPFIVSLPIIFIRLLTLNKKFVKEEDEN